MVYDSVQPNSLFQMFVVMQGSNSVLKRKTVVKKILFFYSKVLWFYCLFLIFFSGLEAFVHSAREMYLSPIKVFEINVTIVEHVL